MLNTTLISKTDSATKKGVSVLESFQYQNVCVIRLIKKAFKYLVYECHFYETQQTSFVKLLDIHETSFYLPSCLQNAKISTKNQFQTLSFWYLSHHLPEIQLQQYQGNVLNFSNASHIYNQKMKKYKQMNYNSQQNRLIRFIFQCALNKLQFIVQKKKQDAQNKEIPYYFLGADGILFSNIIVYTKPIEISLKNGYKINDEQKKILIERLKSIHAKNISYINLSRSCITYSTVASTVASNEKEQKEKRKLIPILKIDNHLQPLKFDFNDQVFNYQIQTFQQILDNSIQTAQTSIGHLEKRWSSQNLYCFISQSEPGKQKKMSIQYELNKIQKLLQIPRIYIAMQQINASKFETTLKQIKKNIANDQYLWCLSKYQQINLIKQYQNMNIRIQLLTKTNGINNLLLISNNSNTNGNSSIQNNAIENLSLYPNNSQTALLLKEFKNLEEERYFPNRQSESMLGWGELAIRYHYNSKNSSHQTFTKMLQKYVKQLEKYKNYKKIRKFYLFYSSKLLWQKNRINQSIFHMKQCYKLIKKNQCLSENEQKNNLQEQGIICHELGRLYTETKRYNEALLWFNRSLQLKDKIYGRYSVQMLQTLYNIIYILLTFETRQIKGVEVQEYIKIISQIKHHLPIEAVFNKWMDYMIIKQSISFINKIEQNIAYMHTNPWQKYQEKAFVAKLSKNKPDAIQCNHQDDFQEISFTNQNRLVLQFFIHVRQAEKRRKDQSIDIDGLKKCRQRISQILEDKRLQNKYQKINIIKLKLIKTYTNKKIMDAQKLQITNYLIRFVQSIKQLKVLVSQLQTNNGNSDRYAKNQLCFSLRQLIYRWSKLFISMVNALQDKSSFRDQIQRIWQWILKQYYQHKLYEKRTSDNQSNNNEQRTSKKYIQCLMYNTSIYNKIKLYHIADILQYCLLLYKFYRDYGHIFNILVYILQKNNGEGETEYKNNINVDKVIENLSKHDDNQMFIIAYILSICMIHMHRFSQSESILEFIIQQISLINKSKKIKEQKTSHTHIYQLLPKQNIYCYQFQYMLLFTFYATHSYHKFIDLFQSISLTQCVNVQCSKSINDIALKQSNYIINLAFHVYYIVFDQSQQNSHLLSLIHKFVQYPFHQNQCKHLYIDTYHMVIKILYKLLNKNNSTKEQLSLFISCIRNIFIIGINYITDKPDKHNRNSIVNQQGILHLFYQSAQHKDECNLIQLFFECIKMMISLKHNQNIKKFLFDQQLIHQMDQLIYQLLCPFLSKQNQIKSPKIKQYLYNFNQILRMQVQNKKKLQIEQSEIDVKVESIIIQKLSKQIIEYIKILVNQHQEDEKDIKLNTVIVSWLPQIIQLIQNKNTPQINQIISILFNWCRFNSMVQQTILCAIWLQIYGNTHHIKHLHNQHTIKRQYQQVVNMLKMTKSTQLQQNTMQIFKQTGIDKCINQTLTKFNKIKQQFEQFMQEYNSLMQWSTESFEYDIDNYVNIVQKLLNKLEIIKFNLSVTIPAFYMTHLLHHLINPIIDSLNEL